MLIELAGEIDTANAASLGDCLCQAIESTGTGLIVAMTAVTFFDSCGVSMMVRVQHAASKQKCKVTWRSMQPYPAKALGIVGLDQLLDFED